jgi:hypothetical protein
MEDLATANWFEIWLLRYVKKVGTVVCRLTELDMSAVFSIRLVDECEKLCEFLNPGRPEVNLNGI